MVAKCAAVIVVIIACFYKILLHTVESSHVNLSTLTQISKHYQSMLNGSSHTKRNTYTTTVARLKYTLMQSVHAAIPIHLHIRIQHQRCYYTNSHTRKFSLAHIFISISYVALKSRSISPYLLASNGVSAKYGACEVKKRNMKSMKRSQLAVCIVTLKKNLQALHN